MLAVLIALVGSGPAEPPPNIVLILADDLGWADLSCAGNRFNETPRIDRLAAEGLRFTEFSAAAPVCSPTRAAILTGQAPARLGMTAHIPGHWRPFEKLVEPPNATRLPPDVPTLAQLLRRAGYATAHLGKWHAGGDPRAQGFDESIQTGGHAVRGRRTSDLLADRAIDFIERRRDRPFFLYICPNAVHIPLDTTPELRAKYEAKPKVEGYSCHPLYAGLLEELDACVGRALDALERHGLAGRTIVVFTSDNGGLEREMGGWPGTLNRPLRSEKGTLYEGGLRVPMIVRWPGVVKPGGLSSRPAISTDLFPTLLEATGVALPADRPIDGVSLVPLWRDPAAAWERDALFWHYPHYHHSRPSGAVRAGDWKAIEFFDTDEVELYHLKDDVGESRNLAAQEPERARALREAMARWRRSVAAQMPRENPAYDAARADEWWDRRKLAPTEAPGTYREPK
jgi:uncharacterized sulfatase